MIDKLCCLSKELKVLGRVTTGLVTEKVCEVYSVYATSVYGTSFICLIYNGNSSGGKLRLEISAASAIGGVQHFAIPILFSKGIYITGSAGFARVTFLVKELY